MAIPPRSVRATALLSTGVLVVTATAAIAVSSRPERAAARVVPTAAPAQAVTADGRITDIQRLGDRVYVKGSFRTIGTYVGSGMPLDPATGARVSAPTVDGQISVAVPDGAGGWYVGGDFRRIGDVETRGLAHLGPDGTPDPEFTHEVDGLVSALDLADGTLWLGGIFSTVDGAPREHLAAVDVGTGELTGFAAPQDRRVTELEHAAASGQRPARVYVGTDRLVALDPDTGATDPTFSADVRGNVRSLLVEGNRILVGGHGLAALDADTGDVDATFGLAGERFPADTQGVVHTLLSSGGRIYAGGDFTTLGGVPGPLVALDPGTGLGDSAFAPSIGKLTYASSDRGVFDLAVVGDTLWVGGSFARVSDEPAGNLAALDPGTGDRLAVAAPTYDNAVNAVDPSGDGLYVGGQFFMTDPVHAPGFAALDAETLLPVDEFEARSAYYFGDMVPGADVIYLAMTNFEGYDGSVRAHRTKDFYYSYADRIRAVDAATGAPVRKLALSVENFTGLTTIGDELYVAQRLENDVRFPRTRISVYSQSTGDLTRRFRLPQPGYVTELSSVGGNLLAVGSFRRWRENGQPAHLAAMEVDPRNGRLQSGFDLHTHGPVYDVESRGGDLYVAGMFDSVNTGVREVEREGLASFDRAGDGYADLVRTFKPPMNLSRSYLTRVVDLDDSVLVLAWHRTFLDRVTGGRLPDPTGGFAPTIDDAEPDPEGIVYSATITVPLAGQEGYRLSFVARAAD